MQQIAQRLLEGRSLSQIWAMISTLCCPLLTSQQNSTKSMYICFRNLAALHEIKRITTQRNAAYPYQISMKVIQSMSKKIGIIAKTIIKSKQIGTRIYMMIRWKNSLFLKGRTKASKSVKGIIFSKCTLLNSKSLSQQIGESIFAFLPERRCPRLQSFMVVQSFRIREDLIQKWENSVQKSEYLPGAYFIVLYHFIGFEMPVIITAVMLRCSRVRSKDSQYVLRAFLAFPSTNRTRKGEQINTKKVILIITYHNISSGESPSTNSFRGIRANIMTIKKTKDVRQVVCQNLHFRQSGSFLKGRIRISKFSKEISLASSCLSQLRSFFLKIGSSARVLPMKISPEIRTLTDLYSSQPSSSSCKSQLRIQFLQSDSIRAKYD